MTAPYDSLITITSHGVSIVPSFALRQATQTFKPIPAAGGDGGETLLPRSVNAELLDLTNPIFRKLATTITVGDTTRPLTFEQIWPGTELLITTLRIFAYKTIGGAPQRTVASGSQVVEGDYTFYCAQLDCIVKSFSWHQDEWGANTGFDLTAEEK